MNRRRVRVRLGIHHRLAAQPGREGVAISDEYISDDAPGSELFDPYETGWWKLMPAESSAALDQTCPKCNGEGYIVVRVYPWDGCSFDEKPCDLYNP